MVISISNNLHQVIHVEENMFHMKRNIYVRKDSASDKEENICVRNMEQQIGSSKRLECMLRIKKSKNKNKSSV